MTREQLIQVIGAIFTVERKYKVMWPEVEHAILEKLAFELHRSIHPTKQEWVKTDFFNQYFSKESQERYLNND